MADILREYFGYVIEKSALIESVVDGAVAFDKTGLTMDIDAFGRPKGPTLVVEDVTDALKKIDGDRVLESVDRTQTWKVRAMILDVSALEALSEDAYTVEDLLAAVEAAGFSWTVRPTSSP